jgi:dual specificity tyrosine-phosphorylation-regulated kinase 1
MWSLGCVLVEMHTGEPLFGGSTQADQICRLIDVVGMPPVSMLEASPPHVICQFFDTIVPGSGQQPAQDCDLNCQVTSPHTGTTYILKRQPKADRPPPRTLSDILGVYSGGPHGRRLGEAGHSTDKYLEFLDFVQ